MLLAKAAANNQDLALAAARIEEARAGVAIADANRYRAVDAYANATLSRISENSGRLTPGAAAYGKDFQLGLTASYELDFWASSGAPTRPRGRDYWRRKTTAAWC